ncbi:MAG: hypothetical protein ACLQVD_11460 [Capsulimonadaceae bacterium]
MAVDVKTLENRERECRKLLASDPSNCDLIISLALYRCLYSSFLAAQADAVGELSNWVPAEVHRSYEMRRLSAARQCERSVKDAATASESDGAQFDATRAKFLYWMIKENPDTRYGFQTKFGRQLGNLSETYHRFFDEFAEQLAPALSSKDQPAATPEQAEPTLVSRLVGNVLEITTEGIAVTVLEEEDGSETEVYFRPGLLQQRGISVGDRFTYSVYDTGTGSLSVIEPWQPVQRTPEELRRRAEEARRIMDILPIPIQDAQR